MSYFEMGLIFSAGLLGVLLVIVLPIVLTLRYSQRERELEHAERMRALELGRTLPKDEPWWTPAKLCASIGMGVPITVFLLAIIAAKGNGASPDHSIWMAAGMVGVAGVICGAIMAIRLPLTQDRSRSTASSKPIEEPDALDVVSRRG